MGGEQGREGKKKSERRRRERMRKEVLLRGRGARFCDGFDQ